jgi:Cof subfamily protein (haloacid dehalogenase superfamily)
MNGFRPAGVRMLATDLDGTLLRPDGTVSDRTRAALRAADAAGLLIAFVTGRPPRWLDAIIDETGHLGVAVGANGAVLYDLAEERVVSAHPIDVATLHALADDLRAAFPAVHFGLEYGDGFAAEPGYVHDWAINPRRDRHGNPMAAPVVGELAEIVTRPVLKLLVKDRAADVDTFLTRADALLAGRASVTHSSRFGLLEIAAPGVTKASGLAELADRCGIAAAEVVAIGDMPNDVPMLEWAGTSYAVGNGHPAARTAADAVLGSNEDDAVALLIESLLG